MNDYDFLISKWNHILNKVENNNGKVYPIEIGEKANPQEIRVKEKEIGYQLPPSYKAVLQDLGKSLSFYYSFSDDTMIPDEFREIFSGEIQWDIDLLQSLDSLADDLIEDGVDYGKNLRGKLEFSHSGNGDIYAFDMSAEGEEKPVIYWDHEEDTITCIADSFTDYLNKITELNCVGSEKWQFEHFLNERGLETESSSAIRWKQWFDSFAETKLSDIKTDMDQLIAFIMYRKRLDEETIQALQVFDKKVLFDSLTEKLDQYNTYLEKRVVCKMIGKGLGSYAEKWVKGLWEEQQGRLDTRLRAYLTARCMPEGEGLELVFQQLGQENDRKISGYDALSHLGSFHSRRVIHWMEERVRFPVTEGWDSLFSKSNPAWDDIKRWTELEEKHEVAIVHALEVFVREGRAISIQGLPPRKEFKNFLLNLKSKQKLRRRTEALEYVKQNI
ncbi:SMI1/KNR4 family protein [Mesobacillus boroniphilus]|uniref:SMI1/KNR4 family protein n=1 Tax=Mesobacillus boroniphilus TaxID=308892 RepID=A0A944CLY6_9BACI|nr:SMI1/KNR4 family protein [Mesobacillus boroniphilus]MBS8265619.1 SMI1/KNR4 family protein [Mesobacillus boroniphilus]